MGPGARCFCCYLQLIISERFRSPKKSWSHGCLGRLKTAEKQRKNSKPSALEALSKHNMSSRIYQAINANIARNWADIRGGCARRANRHRHKQTSRMRPQPWYGLI